MSVVQPSLYEREAVVNAIIETEHRLSAEINRQARVIMVLTTRERYYRTALELRGCSKKDLDRIRDGGDYDPPAA